MKRYIILILVMIFVSVLAGCGNIISDKKLSDSTDMSKHNKSNDVEQTQQGAIDDEKIIYNGKEYLKSKLSQKTLDWLQLTEEKRILSSYFPLEFMIFEDIFGITLMVKDITSTSLTLECTQSGGKPTDELQTGSWFILENWTQENGWKEVRNIKGNNNLAWTDEAHNILINDTVSWKINWEYVYEKLPVGKYRIGKEIMDFRKAGDFDSAIYYAEFEITK